MTNSLPQNFAGLTPEYSSYQTAKIAVLPVPFDRTSSWISGSDKGPAALIDASRNMELYDIETNSEVYKQGITTLEPVATLTSREMVTQVTKKVSSVLADGKFVVTLGGEHTVSVGPIKAHAEFYNDISILQFDAHTDLRPEYLGDPLSHASAMARARECEGVRNLVAVGIRAIDSSEVNDFDRQDVFFAENIHDNNNWFEKALARLGPKVYVTFDLDVFDPSLLPATGTPEPGGLGWYQVISFLKLVCAKRELVGFDVVELCPSPSLRASDFVAAKLVYKMLSYRFL